MLAESMNNRQHPFFALDSMIKLFNLTVVVLKCLADSHVLLLPLRINTGLGVEVVYREVVERNRSNRHISGQRIAQVVGAGIVVVLYLVLSQQSSVLLLERLRLVRSQIKQLKNLYVFDFAYFVSLLGKCVLPIRAIGWLSLM